MGWRDGVLDSWCHAFGLEIGVAVCWEAVGPGLGPRAGDESFGSFSFPLVKIILFPPPRRIVWRCSRKSTGWLWVQNWCCLKYHKPFCRPCADVEHCPKRSSRNVTRGSNSVCVSLNDALLRTATFEMVPKCFCFSCYRPNAFIQTLLNA